MRTQRMRRVAAGFLLVLTALWLPTPAGADPDQGHTATFGQCHFQPNFVVVPQDRVARLVPEHYTIRSPVIDGDQLMANVAIQPFACDQVSAGGTRHSVRGEMVGVEICAPDVAPSCQEDSIKRLDFYVLELVTDSQAYANWLRAGTGLDVTHVSHMSFEYASPPGAGMLFFEVPPPAPSPFRIEGAAGAQNGLSEPFVTEDRVENWWQDTRDAAGNQWTVQLEYPSHDDFLAPADVTITAEEGTRLAMMLATSPAKPTVSLTVAIRNLELIKNVTRRSKG